MKRAQHWFVSKAILFNNWPPFAPHLVINTASLLSTFCKINRSEAPSSLCIIFHSIFNFWSFPWKIFDEEMLNVLKSWKVAFFLWRRYWWCTKTVSSPLLLMRLALPCISGCILRRCQRRIIFSTALATLPGPGAGFPRRQLRLRRLARFLVACTLCINSEKSSLVLLSVQRFCAMCKTFARLIMIVKCPFPLFSPVS